VDSLEAGLGPFGGGLEWLDLNWWRLASWRRSLAAAFDPPERRGMLGTARAVRLEVAGGGLAGAHLLLGWLGARLGWDEATGRTEAGLTVASPGGPVELSWQVADRPDRAPGEVVSVELEAAGVTLSALVQPNGPYLVFESGLEGVAWRERHPAASGAELVAHAFSGTVPAGWLAAVERCRAWGLA